MYANLAEVKAYLNIPTATTTDDALLTTLIQAAQQRINDYTKRQFDAPVTETHYFDYVESVDGKYLNLDGDLSYIASITNNGGALPATEYITDPRNSTPWERIKIKSNSAYYWTYTNQPEDAITVTGRWACMFRGDIIALARATNTVTATVAAPLVPVGSTVYILDCADATFNGTFVVTGNTGATLTWAQTGDNDTDTAAVLLYTPPSIRQACIRLSAWLYRQKDTQQGDLDRPLLVGDGTVIMPTTLPQDVQALLREWVKIL